MRPSSKLQLRDSRVCWHPFTQHKIDPLPLPIASAKNAVLTLENGQEMIDAISSWWSIIHGHAQPDIANAIHKQAITLDHVLFAGCTHEPAVMLSEELINLTPEGLNKVFFSDNGSTAVEVALKASYLSCLRKGETQRTTFIALDNAYHGDTFGAMSVGDPLPFFKDLSPFLFKVKRIPADINALKDVLKEQGEECCAFIFEPLVMGAAGMKMYDQSFLKDSQQLCQNHKVLMIADEVMTGFGRTGNLFASELAGIQPDLMCLAKGLTGGVLPMAATLATNQIFDSFWGDNRGESFLHGHTFTANPIGCAAALESIKIIKRDNIPKRLNEIGAMLEYRLASISSHPKITLRRLGGIVALEVNSSNSGYLAETGNKLRSACQKTENVLLRPLGNVLYAMPPACVTDDQCKIIANAMINVLKSTLD